MGSFLKIKGFPAYITVVFLNAFVDLGHKITIQNTIFKTCEGDQLVMLTAIVNALILLPFILLPTPSGFLADKYPKHQVMRISAASAVILTALITLCYHAGWFWAGFAMTFLLAVQSAFYSPAKYGYIKEIAGKDRLARANGLVQATTMIAILAGTFVFSVLFELYLKAAVFQTEREVLLAIAPLGWLLMAGAGIELLLAWRLPQTRRPDTGMRFNWQRYRRGAYLRDNLAAIKAHGVILASILGLSVFWAIGQVLLAAFPAFAKQSLGLTDVAVVQGMLASAGVGIMLGSLLAGRVSKNHIETGLIPLGALGLAGCLFILPSLGSVLVHSLNILFLGILGGLLIVPLNALIQFHAGGQMLGRVLAGNNLIQNTCMFGFLIVTVIFSQLHISQHLFGLLTLMAIGMALYTLCALPQSLLRVLVALVIGQRYRLEVSGFNHIPEAGGVLLLGNRTSEIDWAMMQMVIPRPVRFVMEKPTGESGWRRWLARLAVAPVVIDAREAPLKADTLKTIGQALNAGEAVCLFSAGTIDRAAPLAGLTDVGEAGVILPFHIRSQWQGQPVRSHEPPGMGRRIRAKGEIVIAFGEPLPMQAETATLQHRLRALAIARP